MKSSEAPNMVSSLDVETQPALRSVSPRASKLRVTVGPVIRQAVGMWLASRALVAIYTYFALLMKPFHVTLANYNQGYSTLSLRDFFLVWDKWDAIWYINIAQRGYFNEQSTAFFPLYPLLIRAVTLIIGQHWILAALIVSNLGTLAAFIALALLAAGETRNLNAARSSLLLFAAFPLAFFLAAPYTESLFIAASAFTLYFARRGMWRAAAVVTFLAALSRPTGIILLPVLLWEYGRQQGWWAPLLNSLPLPHLPNLPWTHAPAAKPEPAARVGFGAGLRATRAAIWRTLAKPRQLLDLTLALGAVPFAILCYMAYLKIQLGHPTYFLRAQHAFWRRQDIPPWSSIPMVIRQFFSLPNFSFWQARDLIDIAPVAVCFVVVALALWKQPFIYTLYMAGLLYLTVGLPVIAPYPVALNSAGRFMLAATPVFLALGQWTHKRPWLELLLVGGGFMLQALFAWFFFNGGWLV